MRVKHDRGALPDWPHYEHTAEVRSQGGGQGASREGQEKARSPRVELRGGRTSATKIEWPSMLVMASSLPSLLHTAPRPPWSVTRILWRGVGAAQADPAALRLLHFEGGAWADTTVSNDTAGFVICEQVTSL